VNDSIIIDGKRWSTDGLPAHMLRSLPATAEVTVDQPVYDEGRIIGSTPSTYTVQLERDGVPLTRGDRAPSWETGERDGWLARPFEPAVH
jgi:hypothetical protein